MNNYEISSGFGEVEWHARWPLVKYLAFSSLFSFLLEGSPF